MVLQNAPPSPCACCNALALCIMPGQSLTRIGIAKASPPPASAAHSPNLVQKARRFNAAWSHTSRDRRRRQRRGRRRYDYERRRGVRGVVRESWIVEIEPMGLSSSFNIVCTAPHVIDSMVSAESSSKTGKITCLSSPTPS
jgi:hypothetical protein